MSKQAKTCLDCGVDTAELLADDDFVHDFKTGLAELDAGQGLSWDELKAQLKTTTTNQ